jgi:FkbM family methyltransferase
MSAETYFHNLRYLRMNARRLEHLATLMLPVGSRSVLEVGAGIGDLSSFFLDRGCSVTSVEPRPDNVEQFRARYQDCGFWPDERLRIVQSDVYGLADRTDVAPHQIVCCYGLLYHLDRPEAVLRNLAQRCTELLLVETAVAYGTDEDVVSFAPEDAGDPTNSITGMACAPSRRWVFNRLRELFAYVYMPLTQPHHEQFRLDWRRPGAPAGRSRAVFVASRVPLVNSHLVQHVPEIQYVDLPQPGALAGLAGHGIVLVDSIFGPVLAYEDDLITQQIREFGAHTRNELALLCAFVDEGDVVYDVGAHIGTFSLPLAGAVGNTGRVISIEPDPGHFRLLAKNLESRGLARQGSPLNVAIADVPGRYAGQATPGNSGATCFRPDPSSGETSALRLDDVHVGIGETRRVSVIKIDVEGMELAVLDSSSALIGRDRPILYMEVSSDQLARYRVSVHQVNDFMRRRGYRLFRNKGERNSGHDEFDLVELSDISAGGEFFDLLAIAQSDEKLARAMEFAARSKRREE